MRCQMCFPTFPVVSVEVGWVLPPALDSPPLGTEGGCDWTSPGTPPVSIGTEAHRGSAEEGLRVWYLPPLSSLLPSTHTTHTGVVCLPVFTHYNSVKVVFVMNRCDIITCRLFDADLHVKKINHLMANTRGIASFG